MNSRQPKSSDGLTIGILPLSVSDIRKPEVIASVNRFINDFPYPLKQIRIQTSIPVHSGPDEEAIRNAFKGNPKISSVFMDFDYAYDNPAVICIDIYLK